MQSKVWALFVAIGILLFSLGPASALTLSEGDGLWSESAPFDESILFSALDRHLSDDQPEFTNGSEMLLAWLLGRFQSTRTHSTRRHWEPEWSARFGEGFDHALPEVDIFQTENRHGSERTPAPVPEPATMLLLGTGLLMCAAFSRKRSKTG